MIDREALSAGLNGNSKPRKQRLPTAEEMAHWTPHGNDEPDDEPERPLPRVWDVCDLVAAYPKQRSPVIHGWLREGEVGNLIAKTKRGKSHTTYGILLSVMNGSAWLGRFQCAQRKVLLIDNELHHEDLAHRIPAVASAMGIPLEKCRDRFKIIPLRGDLRGVYEMRRVLKDLPRGEYGLIVIDAFYRMLPDGTSENDNAAMAMIYNLIDSWAEMTGAAFIVVAHTSKGVQSEKDITDVGAGAGSQSRACDCHMILRPHEQEDCVVLDGALRSWPPVEPMVLRWIYPVWSPADDLDPEKLKGRKVDVQSNKDAEAEDAVLSACQTWMTRGEIRRKTGLGDFRRDRTIRRLLDKKWIETRTEERKRHPETEVFRKTIHAPDRTRATEPDGFGDGFGGATTGDDHTHPRLIEASGFCVSSTDPVEGTGFCREPGDEQDDFR